MQPYRERAVFLDTIHLWHVVPEIGDAGTQTVRRRLVGCWDTEAGDESPQNNQEAIFRNGNDGSCHVKT